jgi:two-component system, chemotaxis family, protein-glutamate methylesterase/glutaminase
LVNCTCPPPPRNDLNKFCGGPEFGCSVNAFTVPTHNVIVIGASAGGISPVRTLLSKFPKTVPAAIFVVVHTSPDGPGMLATVFGRATDLTMVSVEDKMVIRDGHVYVAPPDYHLIVDGRHARLSRGPREHRFRPAVDPLFRTAARHYGKGTIGVVLSGHMADGTHGLNLIKTAGGCAIVQDPDEAEVPAMPLSAMRRGQVDYVLPVEEMPRVIMGLLMNARPSRTRPSPSKQLRTEAPSPEQPGAPDALRTSELDGPPSPFTCPDCGGTLWELKDKNLVRYRCHVGHGFNSESLRDGMDEKLEDTLWSALRAIEENIELRTRMKTRVKDQRLKAFVVTLDQDIADLKQRASTLRCLLVGSDEQEEQEEQPRAATGRKRHG